MTAEACLDLAPAEVWGGNASASRPFRMPGFDGFLASIPYGGSAKGGDVYMLSTCGKSILSRVLLADVTGHGAAVTKSAERLREILGRYIGQPNHEQLLADLNESVGRTGDTAMATMAVAGLYSSVNEFIYAGAGHPPIMYKRRDSQWRPMEECAEDGRSGHVRDIPLGALPGTAYQQHKVFLRQGDLLLFYTDAYTDLAGGRTGWMEALNRLDSDAPEAIVRALQARFPATEHDDATLICLKVTSGSKRGADN